MQELVVQPVELAVVVGILVSILFPLITLGISIRGYFRYIHERRKEEQQNTRVSDQNIFHMKQESQKLVLKDAIADLNQRKLTSWLNPKRKM